MKLIAESLDEHSLIRDRIAALRFLLGPEVALTIEIGGLSLTLPARPAPIDRTPSLTALHGPATAQSETAATPAPHPVLTP
jgi:hypothetical protein